MFKKIKKSVFLKYELEISYELEIFCKNYLADFPVNIINIM